MMREVPPLRSPARSESERMMKGSGSNTIRISSMLLFLVLGEVAKAENMGFLPGDAFFHSKMSFLQIEEAAKSKNVALRYVTPTERTFSGYAGYFRLNLQIDDETFLANLSSAYEWLRYTSPRRNRVVWEYRDEGDTIVKSRKAIEIEDNPFSIFVYNRHLDINDIHLSVKYNENWKSEATLFNKHKNSQPLLDEFTRSYEVVAESWSNAERVPALKVELPRVELNRGKGVDEPIVLPTSEVTVVITSSEDYEDLFSCALDTQVVTVTVSGAQYYEGNDGKWERQEMIRILQEGAEN